MERNPRPAATVLYQVIHVPPACGRKLLRTCTGMDSSRAGRRTGAAGNGCVRRYRTDGGSVLSGNPRAARLRQEAAAHMHRDGFLPRGTQGTAACALRAGIGRTGGCVFSGNPRAARPRQEAAAHMHRDGFLPRGPHDVCGGGRLHALCARVLDGLAAAFSQVIHVPPACGRKLLRTCTGMDSCRAGRGTCAAGDGCVRRYRTDWRLRFLK